MPCKVCGAPVVVYDDNNEVACSAAPEHDIDGSELVDDEFPRDDPSDAEQDYDEENPATFPADRPWAITTDAEASWALAKVQRARFELEQIGARWDEQVRVLRDWRERVSKAPLRDDEFFTGRLQDFYDRVRDEGRLYGKSKSYSLPNGTLSARSGSERVETDNAVVVDFAVGSDRFDLLNIAPPLPNKAAIKKALKAGEVIPGAQIVRGDDSFTVEVSSEETPSFAPMPESGAA